MEKTDNAHSRFGRRLLDRVGLRLWPKYVARGELRRWPLFKRISQAASRDSLPGSALGPQPHRFPSDTPIRRIQEEDFTATVLVRELSALSDTGGELHLPPGRIELKDTLSLGSGVRLVGTPGRTEFIFRGINFGLRIVGRDSEPVSGVRVEHLRIRHEECPPGFSSAVIVSRATDIVLNEVELRASAIGFFFVDSVNRIRMNRCTASNAGLDGFLMLRSVTDVTLSSCVAEGCGQTGILFADWQLPEHIDPNDFKAQADYAADRIAFSATDPGPRRITVSNCIIRKNRKIGICTDGGGLLRINDSIIADNECEGLTFDNGTWCCRVHGCRVSGNGNRGAQTEEELNEDFVTRDGFLKDGTSVVKLPGVSMDNAVFCRVESCLVEGNYGEGVKFVRACHACSVTNNTIVNNNAGYSKGHPHFGVRIGSDPAQHPDQFDFPSNAIRVIDNDVIGAHMAGILLNQGVFDNVIHGNHIAGQTGREIENRSRGFNIIESRRS